MEENQFLKVKDMMCDEMMQVPYDPCKFSAQRQLAKQLGPYNIYSLAYIANTLPPLGT